MHSRTGSIIINQSSEVSCRPDAERIMSREKTTPYSRSDRYPGGIIAIFTLLLLFFRAVVPLQAEQILFRISVENTARHVQTRYAARFAQRLEEELGDVLDVRLYHSAELFRDSEVVRALSRGSVEMAIPGTWQLGRFVPEIDYFLLPEFLGATESPSDRFLATPPGRVLLNRIETNLDVAVPGLWMDLGPAHIFTTRKEIRIFEDLQGLKIRVAGGLANKLRIEALGAEGVIIPWPDLPPMIADGSVDGILTTFETVRSAALWEYGIGYAFTDYEYFPQYVPLVASRIWRNFSAEQRELFCGIWDENVLLQRRAARQAQDEARRSAVRHGVTIVEPDPRELQRIRRRLLDNRSLILDRLNFDAGIFR